jgi:cytoskeletal protein CcmA (bactofilin family)
MFKLKLTKNPKIDTLVDARTRINGDVEFAGGLHLDGCIHGNVSGEAGAESVLWVSDRGEIDGSVMVSHIVLNGVVKGDIDATGRVELGEKARVLGNVRYSVIESAVGAQINGKLIHRAVEDDHDAATAPAEDPTG